MGKERKVVFNRVVVKKNRLRSGSGGIFMTKVCLYSSGENVYSELPNIVYGCINFCPLKKTASLNR